MAPQQNLWASSTCSENSSTDTENALIFLCSKGLEQELVGRISVVCYGALR